jgi:ubiquinone/menaquinone biosynthesis C-methylase UbiE
MDAKEYEVMYRVEDFHWWYRGMETITRRVIEQRYPRGSKLRILDAGCGTGAVMGYLADYGTVTGLDFSAEALHWSKVRNRTRLTRGSVVALPYPDAAFDLVASFDVICVFSDGEDVLPLHEFVRVLVPGGRVLLRLPATPWLHGQHDVSVDIQQRYTTRMVKDRLRAVGFEPEQVTYANTILFPLAVVKRFSERFFPPQNGSDLTIGMGLFNGLLRVALSAEAPLVAWRTLPFGLTVVALARKP